MVILEYQTLGALFRNPSEGRPHSRLYEPFFKLLQRADLTQAHLVFRIPRFRKQKITLLIQYTIVITDILDSYNKDLYLCGEVRIAIVRFYKDIFIYCNQYFWVEIILGQIFDVM